METLTEIWKPVEGYEGDYLISNHGRVRSLKRHGDRLMPLTIQATGYYAVMLYMYNKPKCIKVHRLVAEAFIPNPNGYEQINHKDGNKLNNHVDNLEWCTPKQNVAHSWQTGLATPHAPSDEGKQRLRDLWKGKPKDPEAVKKLSQALKGRKRPDTSARQKGKPLCRKAIEASIAARKAKAAARKAELLALKASQPPKRRGRPPKQRTEPPSPKC